MLHYNKTLKIVYVASKNGQLTSWKVPTIAPIVSPSKTLIEEEIKSPQNKTDGIQVRWCKSTSRFRPELSIVTEEVARSTHHSTIHKSSLTPVAISRKQANLDARLQHSLKKLQKQPKPLLLMPEKKAKLKTGEVKKKKKRKEKDPNRGQHLWDLVMFW